MHAPADDGELWDVLSLLLDVETHDAPASAENSETDALQVPAPPEVRASARGADSGRSAPCAPVPAAHGATTYVREERESPEREPSPRERKPPRSPAKKVKKNAYRERMKSEMAALRQHAFELEGELLELQRRRRQQTLVVPPRANQGRFQAWKRIALQHRDALKLTQRHNRGLRDAVGRQIMVIEQLQSLLLVNAASAAAVGATAVDLTRQADLRAKRRTPIDASDEELLASYIEQLEAAYQSTERVLSESSLDRSSQEPAALGICLKRYSDGSEFFESTETTLMPLEFARVGHDAWKMFASLYPNQANRLALPEGAIVGKSNLSGGNYDLTIHFAARMFEAQPGHPVLVWKALTIGDGEFAGMNSDETGWLDFRPRRSAIGAEAAVVPVNTTVAHSCVRIAPIFSVPPGSAKAKRFTELIMRSADDDIMTIARMMESVMTQEPAFQSASGRASSTLSP